jgi:hypothetical protein
MVTHSFLNVRLFNKKIHLHYSNEREYFKDTLTQVLGSHDWEIDRTEVQSLYTIFASIQERPLT